jgi:hypothetical protein
MNLILPELFHFFIDLKNLQILKLVSTLNYARKLSPEETITQATYSRAILEFDFIEGISGVSCIV